MLRAAALAAVALLGVLGWFFFLRDTSEPVSVAEAVTSSRAARGGSVTSGPAPGVYVYVTSGFEEVDALVGSRHEYPSESTITVRPGGCGVLLLWDALEERSTTWDTCVSDRVQGIRGYIEVHAFFGNRDRRTYRYGEAGIARPAGEPGTTWTATCSTGDTTETVRGTVVGPETVEVGGAPVGTVHIREQTRLEGTTRGSGVREWWLLPETGLFVRQVVSMDKRTSSAIGDVRYRERYELLLTALAPRR